VRSWRWCWNHELKVGWVLDADAEEVLVAIAVVKREFFLSVGGKS